MSALKFNAKQPATLWYNNPVLVQLLGLSPVLAVSTTVVNGLGLGLSTALIMVLSSVTVSLLRASINRQWRFVWFLMITACYTTLLDIMLQWFYFPLHKELGIYVPLICCNFAVLTRLEAHAFTHHWRSSVKDAAVTGSGFIAALVVLSSLREFIGSGTLMANWQLLLPATSAAAFTSESSTVGGWFDFALLLPAAFILLGLLIATRNLIDSYLQTRLALPTGATEAIKRARVTGSL
jgi:electron transport complex protein RnfE